MPHLVREQQSAPGQRRRRRSGASGEAGEEQRAHNAAPMTGRAFPRPPRAVLLDLDGTLVDTEPLHYCSTNLVLAEFGHQLSPAEFQPFIGSSDVPFWTALAEKYGLPGQPREWAERRTGAFLRLLRTNALPTLPGVLELLDLLERHGIPAAVASSSARAQIDAMLAAAGLDRRIAVRRSGHDDCARSKPHPDVYLAAAAALGVAAADCLAVEDSRFGVAAAVAAGAYTVAVPCPSHPDQALGQAHLRLASLRALAERLSGLLG